MRRYRRHSLTNAEPRRKVWGGKEHRHTIDLMVDGGVINSVDIKKLMEEHWAGGRLVNPVRKARYKMSRIVIDGGKHKKD